MHMEVLRTSLLFKCLACVFIAQVDACTNLIVTPGASVDGSTIYSYSADSAALYGTLDRLPGKKNISAGATKKIYDWDSGVYLGEIEEAEETYDVIGNMNEHQLTIGETTFGGVEALTKGQAGAVMDYGNLIWTTLQRAKTVPEAITVMADLVARYGYASEGESFTLADPREAWIMEMIGKGQGDKGAVWMAVRIPDGHVSAHANQARIPFVDMSKPDVSVARWSSDVVDFAISKKLYDPAKGIPFAFSDVYDPLTFSGARNGEARVWSFFSKVTSIPGFEDEHLEYASGSRLSPRMPLSVPVKEKLRVHDIMMYMRDHYDNTALNMTSDIGSGAWAAKFRDRPLTWTFQGESYVNERTIGTQQTSWHFVANMRHWLPPHIGGVFWFGVDDASFSVHIPFYSFAEVPPELKTGTGSISDVRLDSLFWLSDLVANKVFSKNQTLNPKP
jgi:dipeptidase